MRTVNRAVKELGCDARAYDEHVSTGLSLVTWLAVTVCLTGMSIAQTTTLSPPWAQKVLPKASLPNRSQSEIGHGYLWSFQRAFSAPSDDAIVITSLGNGESTKLRFWLQNASRMWIDDVAVGGTDAVVVAGAYIRSDSSDEKRFIARLNASGAVVSKTDLGAYEAEHVCIAADNTVWTFGQEWSSEATGTSYAMLRNYSLEGTLLKSRLSRHDVPADGFNLGRRFHQMGIGRGRSYLRCGNTSVGVYLAPIRMWHEVRLNDGAEQSWSVISPADGGHKATHTPVGRRIVSGVALLGEHEVYASVAEVTGVGASESRGLYRLQLASDGSAQWQLVKGSVSSDPVHSVARLLGADGESLVYLLAGSASSDGLPLCCSRQYFAGHPPLLWSKLISASNE